MPQKPFLRSWAFVAYVVLLAMCGEKYPASHCTALTSIVFDRREFGCSVEWTCEQGEFLIDCDFSDPDFLCRCVRDGEEVGSCTEANFCDHTDENRWVAEVNHCCGFDVEATEFAPRLYP